MDSWAGTPTDILLNILGWLTLIDDLIVAHAVCKSWRLSVHVSAGKIHTPPNAPWLMLAEEITKGNQPRPRPHPRPRRFFNLSDNKIYHMNLPETMNRKCRSIGFGWILTNGLDLQINLIHPLSKLKIDLPPESSFVEQLIAFEPERVRLIQIKKAVASTNPWDTEAHCYNQKCIIMTIYGQYSRLAFTKPGNKTWIDIKTPPKTAFSDIAYYKDKFYAAGCFHVYTCINIDDNSDIIPTAATRTLIPSWICPASRKYLVESSGELLLVCRYLEHQSEPRGSSVTVYFDVLKLKEKEEAKKKNKYELVKVESLDNQALLIGDSVSFSLTPSTANGCKENCIYFTDDYFLNYFEEKGSGSDTGVYNLKDHTIEPYYNGRSLSHFCTPLWYI
ncbi:hypothetical protein ACFE04_014802 [Oxalis oulophora]